MLRKILILVLLLQLPFLCSCQSQIKDAETSEPVEISDNNHSQAANVKIDIEDELGDFIGTWQVGKPEVVQRGYLPDQDSDVIGKSLLISKDKIEFNGQSFICTEKERQDVNKVMDNFNIAFGNAVWLCNGRIDDEDNISGCTTIEFYTMTSESPETWISLVKRDENTIMIYVGECYKYIGFYDLIKK
ncbi:MAG: hypothetical protein Q8865_09460 [Bacillota bacterium]|nr:hypothetical protein [Bacillota bacterium]